MGVTQHSLSSQAASLFAHLEFQRARVRRLPWTRRRAQGIPPFARTGFERALKGFRLTSRASRFPGEENVAADEVEEDRERDEGEHREYIGPGAIEEWV